MWRRTRTVSCGLSLSRFIPCCFNFFSSDLIPPVNLLGTSHILYYGNIILNDVVRNGFSILFGLTYHSVSETKPKKTKQRAQMCGDKEVVLAAVIKDGWALRLASDEMRGDKEVVLAAVMQDDRALQFASDEMRGDKEVVLAAVMQDGWPLRFASEELRGDKEVVLAAVTRSGRALQFASEEMRGDKQVVLAAVIKDGWALQFASEEFRGDKEVVLVAIENDSTAWNNVSNKTVLRRDPTIAAAMVTKDKAFQMLQKLGNRRSTCGVAMDSVDYSIALIVKRFDEDASILEAAQEASAKFHAPWSTTGRMLAPHKRSRASFENDFA
jgi:hypothetical protein